VDRTHYCDYCQENLTPIPKRGGHYCRDSINDTPGTTQPCRPGCKHCPRWEAKSAEALEKWEKEQKLPPGRGSKAKEQKHMIPWLVQTPMGQMVVMRPMGAHPVVHHTIPVFGADVNHVNQMDDLVMSFVQDQMRIAAQLGFPP
jgi:hypothetical protein